MSRTDAVLSKGELAVPEIGRLIVELKTRPSLREAVRRAASDHMARVLDEVAEELNAMTGRAQRLGSKGLAVIFDSLEKLRGISTNWSDVLASAERIFAGGRRICACRSMPCTRSPTARVTRRRFEHVRFMPMIKLRERDGREFQAGGTRRTRSSSIASPRRRSARCSANSWTCGSAS